jgi:hypothetical protein
MDFFSQAQADALRRLKDAFEQKLLDEDEYKAEKAKVLNATAGAAPAPPAPPPPAEDDDGFELVGVQTAAERAAESRRRAEADGSVVEIDDEPTAPPPPARKKPAARKPAVARPTPRREARVALRCRRVYFGTALRRDVTVVFAPSGITMEWQSDTSRLYIETRLAASHMTSYDMYHGPARGGGGEIREFFAIGLRQAPSHLRSIQGFEPTDDAGARKYIVAVLEGDALATYKREAVPAVIWAGHAGWPAAPVLGTVAAARPFLEGVAAADAAAGFVVPPVIQSYKRRVDHPVEEVEERVIVVRRSKPARKDIVPLTTAEKAAVLHAIAQLDGKATQRKVRRAAESALGAPEGALDEKKAAVKEVCEDEMSKQASESARAKRRKIDKLPTDTPQGLAACFAEFYPDSPAEPKAKFQQFVLDNTLCPRHVLNMPVEKCESMLQQHGFEGVVVFTFQSRLREVCLG